VVCVRVLVYEKLLPELVTRDRLLYFHLFMFVGSGSSALFAKMV
jgi:hypothetical protein